MLDWQITSVSSEFKVVSLAGLAMAIGLWVGLRFVDLLSLVVWKLGSGLGASGIGILGCLGPWIQIYVLKFWS